MTEPILTYPDPNLPYVLFTDASKYAWACVLTQEKTHQIEEKEVKCHDTHNMNLWCFSCCKFAAILRWIYSNAISMVPCTHGAFFIANSLQFFTAGFFHPRPLFIV